jgi:hypothetical protein
VRASRHGALDRQLPPGSVEVTQHERSREMTDTQKTSVWTLLATIAATAVAMVTAIL